MADLSQDELTVLMIAAEGESMMPIGRWEKPVQSLVVKGYLQALDKFNNVITATGRAAVIQDEDDTARQMIQAHNAVIEGKNTTSQDAEQIAAQLVDLAELSSKITGDDKIQALRKWGKTILERSIELLEQKFY